MNPIELNVMPSVLISAESPLKVVSEDCACTDAVAMKERAKYSSAGAVLLKSVGLAAKAPWRCFPSI